ncbi:hypothetical protein MIR68_006998 [Amoeboaphelidium protococcarum]|nr:hypothetical protein MIR68_006998 [Amoeboaphelidium protococcarum]
MGYWYDFIFGPKVPHSQWGRQINSFLFGNKNVQRALFQWEMLYYTNVYPKYQNFLNLPPVHYVSRSFIQPLQNQCHRFWNTFEYDVKSIVFYTVLLYAVFKFLKWARSRTLCQHWKALKTTCIHTVFNLLKLIPSVRRTIQLELGKVLDDVEDKLFKVESTHKIKPLAKLPAKSMSNEQIQDILKRHKELEHVDWRGGKVSGTVYHGGKELSELLVETYSMFSHSNPLHPDVFPSTRLMEAEVVSMLLNMFNAPMKLGGDKKGEDSTGGSPCGNITSGGTESILMSVKAHRDWAFHTKGITEPEIVIPITAHAAFDKAAAYFKVKVTHVDIDKNNGWRVDMKKMRRAITSNTIMIVGSAPNYPHGIFDDIEQLGKLAQSFNIGLHVDCCLGSFIVPFLAKAGFGEGIRPFDFRVPGVTSISCDTHKFGFAPKGSSVIMYRSAEVRKYQYFVFPEWSGGIYASPSIAGSRSGALVASCYAALLHMGESGYIESTKKIVTAARAIKEGVKSIEGIEVCGDPLAMVIAFTSQKYNIYSIGDTMTAKGWNLNTLQHPAAIHICCTLPTVNSYGQFIADLKDAVEQVRIKTLKAIAHGDVKQNQEEGNAAIYGMAASIPDKRLVGDIAAGYLDALTKLRH